jgi:pimeloyl-ACP methyl ester carboxylesterase
MALIVVLLVNAAVLDRQVRAAEPFAGGQVLDLGAISLNVRQYGPASADRAVVLLHGYSTSLQWWDAVAPLLSHDVRVVALDLIGHGGSPAPRDPARYSADAQADAVHSALDALGVRHAVLVGHSMGGFVATALAENAPDLVERVAVSDTPADQGMTEMPPLSAAICWPVIGAAIDRLRPIDAVDQPSLQTGFATDFPVPELAYRSLKRMTHNALCGAKTAASINEQRSVADRLAGLGKPVLVVWGEHDVLTPTKANVDRYRAAGISPVIISGAGHSPHVEKPAEFAHTIDTFQRS